MFSPRWSTFMLLCLAGLAFGLGLCGGRRLTSQPVVATTSVPPATAVQAASPAPAPASDTPRLTPTAPETDAVLSDPAADCRRLLAQPVTPQRNDALFAALEKLAETNPQAALALARSETNQRLRAQLLAAAFRGWGVTQPRAAADWILAQPAGSLDASAAIAAVLKGAAQHPDDAIQLTQDLNQRNPDQAREYGDALIYALGQNGNFQRAADFAANTPGHGEEWMAAAYGNWANYQPQAAATSARQLADGDLRRMALDAVIPAWGQSDSPGLADFAMQNLPDGDQKNRALTDALVNWATDHPVDAANWVNNQTPGPALDAGAAAIATQPEVMKQPDVAMNWAETITNPDLRSRTVAAIVQTWELTDPAAALAFIQTSPDLTPDDRSQLLSATAPKSGDGL